MKTQFNPINFTVWLNRGLVISLCIFVYTSMQKSIFNAGFTNFSMVFHQLDSILNSIKLPLVFTLAGAIYAHLLTRSTFEKLTYKIIDYLIYPFVLWTILQGFVQIVFSGYTGVNTLLTDIYFNLSDEPSNHLGLLIGLSFSLIAASMINRFSQNIFIKIFILMCFYILSIHAKRLGWSYPFNYFSQYGFFLLLGLFVYTYLTNNINLTMKKPTLTIFYLSLILWIPSAYILHITLGLSSYDEHPLSFFNSLFALGIIFSGFILLPSKNSKIVHLTALSFSGVFFMHEIFGYGARQILVKTFSVTDSQLLLFVVYASALLIPLAITHLIIKKHFPWLLSAPKKYSSKIISRYFIFKLQQHKFIRTLSIVLILSLVGTYSWINYTVNDMPNPLAKEVALTHIELSKSPKDISEGRRLAQIYGCYMGCHGPNMEGGIFSRSRADGALYSSNLTIAVEQYTPDALVDIVRLGTFPNGAIIKAGMPYTSFNLLTDRELTLIFSFIAQQPKQSKKTRASVIGLPNKLAFITGKKHLPGETILAAREHFKPLLNSKFSEGARIARSACAECHGDFLTGGTHVGAPHLAVAKAYSYSQFKRLLQTGVKLNNETAKLMGTVAKIRYSNFKEEEIQSIYNFLKMYNFPSKK